uniref:SRCR domain-containing protein n=1 Tax=Myripristis murdjan TaxID=586833 RepID=A0A667ZBY7_9TELE
WFDLFHVTMTNLILLHYHSNNCTGKLEVKQHGDWTPVGVGGPDWNLRFADIVCRQLDCGSAVSVGRRDPIKSLLFWVISPSCLQSGSTLLECVHIRSLSTVESYHVEITCSGNHINDIDFDESVRLVNGNSLCSGRVEVKSNQSWSSVCEEDFDHQDAQVVCRELGCGAPSVLQGALYGEGEAPVWSKEFQCEGTESALLDCRSSGSARNKSVESVRLMNGNSLCSGRVEVKSNQSWSSVCEDDFDHQDAQVVCRELGCGAPSVLQGALYGEGEAPVWSKEFQCEGTESALLHCRSSGSARNSCSPGKAVGLTCSGRGGAAPDNQIIRLVGGANHCAGRLQMKQHDDWRHVVIWRADWTLKTATVVCGLLDCGSAVSVALRGHSAIESSWAISLSCLQSGSTLRECSMKSMFLQSELKITCSESVRLVNGNSLCSGRVEVKSNQLWSSVCEDDFDHQDAQVVCRELGCGAPSVLQGALYGEGEALVWSKEFQCEGTESVLTDCGSSGSARKSCLPVEITCSEPDNARLVGGANRCAGRMEVKSNQSWSSVCKDDFDRQDAQVVCRELGCGAPSVLQGAFYGEMEAPMWSKEFQCEGSESVLTDCGSSGSARNSCSPGKAVGLTCSGRRFDVRLAGEPSRCAGRLEMEQHGDWQPVIDFYSPWNLKAAAVVCGQLGCGSAVSTEIREAPTDHSARRIIPRCYGSESALRECMLKMDSASTSYILEVICSEPDNVRLVNGNSLCSGRVEVKTNQSWSSVCKDDFDHQDAQVVCRELGCGAPSVLQGALYGEGEAPVWSREFQCEGSESALLHCRSSGSARNSCSPGKAVGLTCSGRGGAAAWIWLHFCSDQCNFNISVGARLVGGASRCAGSLQMKQHEGWKPVANGEADWTLKAAAVVCGLLECGSALSVEMNDILPTGPVLLINPSCLQSGYTVRECFCRSKLVVLSLDVTTFSPQALHSICFWLEVKSNQLWSSVCEHDFDHQDAQVVCRELGCGAPSVLQGALYGEGEALVWSKEFQCEGTESALLHCRSSGSARNSCSPGKAVGLTCSGRRGAPDNQIIRLVGGANHCAGRLQMKQHDDWRHVVIWSAEWTLKAAAVVCGLLDCGSAVSVARTRNYIGESSWAISLSCLRSGSTLRECSMKSMFLQSELEITCSGNINSSVSPMILALAWRNAHVQSVCPKNFGGTQTFWRVGTILISCSIFFRFLLINSSVLIEN